MDSEIERYIEESGGHGDPPPVGVERLEGAPPLAWSDFKHPKLRQHPKNGSAVKWLAHLGDGRDGIVYKATIGDSDKPVAVKIFWHTHRPPRPPPPPARPPWYPGAPVNPRPAIVIDRHWSFEAESRKAAVLEKLKWAAADTDTEHPILVKKEPRTPMDALKNLYAFSNEGRHSPRASRPGRTPPPPFPSLPECYGWIRVKRADIPEVQPAPEATVDEHLDWHWGIVYEFVPGAKQDLVVGQAHLDFFHAVGISMHFYKCDNWHGGRLVDMSDLYTVFCWNWHACKTKTCCPREAEDYFRTLDFVQANTARRQFWRPRKGYAHRKGYAERPSKGLYVVEPRRK